jgi:hypothetical protein
MYIILKGFVNVVIETPLQTGIIEKRIVNSLYDGEHFGEYAMMKT